MNKRNWNKDKKIKSNQINRKLNEIINKWNRIIYYITNFTYNW